MTEALRLRRKRRLLAGVTFAMLAILVLGCGSSGGGDPLAPVTGGGGDGAPTLTAANSLYILQPGDAFFLPATPAYLSQYAKSATGSPNPTAEITGQNQVLFEQVAINPTGKLYGSAVTAGSANQTEMFEYQGRRRALNSLHAIPHHPRFHPRPADRSSP